MNEIEIRLDWRKIDVTNYQSMLSKRFFGRWGWTFVAFAGVFTAGIGYAVFEHLIGPGDSAIIAAILGATVFGLLATRLQRKLKHALLDVPARREPSTIIVNRFRVMVLDRVLVGADNVTRGTRERIPKFTCWNTEITYRFS